MKNEEDQNREILEELEYLPYLILQNLDYESQLRSIKSLLSSHEKADEVVSKDIDEITKYLKNYIKEHDDLYQEYLHDERAYKIQTSIYQSAAHCMASVGMLAPFVESLFHQGFHGIREVFFKEKEMPNTHIRWAKGGNDIWDCHYVWSENNRRKDLVKGILQLSEAVGLLHYLPEKAELELMLTVLFSYRNKIFHCGFEWPLEERQKFSKRIKKDNWPQNWFSFATSGGEPWIIYLNNEFVCQCLEKIELIIEGFAFFIKNKIQNIQQESFNK